MKLPRFNEASYAHFVTTKVFENKPIFKDNKCCEILSCNIDFYRNKLKFKLLGYVIMPDHVHIIAWWDVEEQNGLTISKVMHDIKNHSARQIVDYLNNQGRRGPLTAPKPRLGQGTQAARQGGIYPHRRMSEQRHRIWQPSFYDFNIYSEEKLHQKLAYIHLNPVRAGLCRNPEDWSWSSYKFYEYGDKGGIQVDSVK